MGNVIKTATSFGFSGVPKKNREDVNAISTCSGTKLRRKFRSMNAFHFHYPKILNPSSMPILYTKLHREMSFPNTKLYNQISYLIPRSTTKYQTSILSSITKLSFSCLNYRLNHQDNIQAPSNYHQVPPPTNQNNYNLPFLNLIIKLPKISHRYLKVALNSLKD